MKSEEIRKKLILPNAERLFYLRYAIQKGISLDEIYELTKIDKWFLENLAEIVNTEEEIKNLSTYLPAGRQVNLINLSTDLLWKAKQNNNNQILVNMKTKLLEEKQKSNPNYQVPEDPVSIVIDYLKMQRPIISLSKPKKVKAINAYYEENIGKKGPFTPSPIGLCK